jgi:hypothetical protein
MRRCVGSKTFGIEPHEAPIADFPNQPSRKDGLGVMCKPHWSQYTGALRKAAQARKAAGQDIPAKPRRAAKAIETANIANAEDAAIACEAKRAKAPTKRERRRTPMAHVPAATDVPASVEQFVTNGGGKLPIEAE